MQIRVDLSGLTLENKRSKRVRQLLYEGLVDLVESVSMRTMRKVKSVMPVDTGRARAMWGLFTPEHIVNHVKLAGQQTLAEPIWRVKDRGLTIEQGVAMTPRNYIEDLNAGSSLQAPMMFLDEIAEQEATAFSNEAAMMTAEIL